MVSSALFTNPASAMALKTLERNFALVEVLKSSISGCHMALPSMK